MNRGKKITYKKVKARYIANLKSKNAAITIITDKKVNLQMEEQNKNKVLILYEGECPVSKKFAKTLGHYFKVREICLLMTPKKRSLISRWVEFIKKFNKEIKKFNPDKIIVISGVAISVWMAFLFKRIFKLSSEMILFKYDIESFRQLPTGFLDKCIRILDKKIEKYCLVNSDKIIHKGLKDELSLLTFYDKIRDKPHYLFREFIDKEVIQRFNPGIKLSKKDKEIHTVYVGGWYFNDTNQCLNFFELYRPLYENGIHVHVYTAANNKEIMQMEEYERKFKYFHYEGNLPHKELIKEITRYDFGLNYYGLKGGITNLFIKTSFSNKSFDYISAKLPIIANSELTALGKFVKENGLGIVHPLNKNDHARIKEIKGCFRKSYTKFIINIENFLNTYSEKGLIEFLKK